MWVLLVKPARFRLEVIDGIFFLTHNSPFCTGSSTRNEFSSGKNFNAFGKRSKLNGVEIEGKYICHHREEGE